MQCQARHANVATAPTQKMPALNEKQQLPTPPCTRRIPTANTFAKYYGVLVLASCSWDEQHALTVVFRAEFVCRFDDCRVQMRLDHVSMMMTFQGVNGNRRVSATRLTAPAKTHQNPDTDQATAARLAISKKRLILHGLPAKETLGLSNK